MKNLTVPVVFEVELDPGRKGVVPRLMGSINELGFWDTEYGVDARRIAKDSPIWKVKVHMPQRSFFYFNWVLMKKREVVEEDQYRQADIGVFGGLMKTKYGEGSGEFIMDGGCKVSVATHYHLSYNESLAVVGSGDFLGNWESSGTSKCFSMNDVWSTKFEMKHETTEEFKLVILDRESGQIKRWQDGENRVIKIEEGLNSKSVYVPWGGRYLQEGIIIPIITIVECFDNRTTVGELSLISSPPNLSRAAFKLFLTNGELDDDISKDLELTLAQNPTFKDAMALLCNDDNINEAEKTLTKTSSALDIQMLIGDGDGVGHVQEKAKRQACHDLGLPDLIQDLDFIKETIDSEGTQTIFKTVESPRSKDVLDLKQLPFFAVDELAEEINNGGQKSTTLESAVLIEASSPNEVFDTSLKQLPFFAVNELPEEANSSNEPPFFNGIKATDTYEKQIEFEIAVSSGVYIDNILNTLMQLQVSSAEGVQESTSYEQKNATSFETASSLEASSPGEATNDNLMQLELFAADELSESTDNVKEKPTFGETALSSETYSPRDEINAILKPFKIALSSEEKWSKPRRAAFKMFNFVNDYCYRLVF
ncbi:hypothetical protein LOTGIDRAFT_156261 [Lottia gigantea]|uniref:CBM20 domain-containing protein n=1 Tax=Lottia gigantea TaxID=225164 RepID=V4CR96_LOTGI|nr:hypothetical protein LOTGIDRAFT_156261 [Lottia gigantea]ESP05010.1 hypothetical protein LOTGIDRAFT_156261 [Lottia gigantea]